MKKIILYEEFGEIKDITGYLGLLLNGNIPIFYIEAPSSQKIYDDAANEALTNDKLEFECYLETLHYRIKFEVECYFDTPYIGRGEVDKFPHKDDIPDYPIKIEFTIKQVFEQNPYSLSILYGKITDPDKKEDLLKDAKKEGIRIDANNYKNLRLTNSLLNKIGSEWNKEIRFKINWHDINEDQEFNYDLCKIFGYSGLLK